MGVVVVVVVVVVVEVVVVVVVVVVDVGLCLDIRINPLFSLARSDGAGHVAGKLQDSSLLLHIFPSRQIAPAWEQKQPGNPANQGEGGQVGGSKGQEVATRSHTRPSGQRIARDVELQKHPSAPAIAGNGRHRGGGVEQWMPSEMVKHMSPSSQTPPLRSQKHPALGAPAGASGQGWTAL